MEFSVSILLLLLATISEAFHRQPRNTGSGSSTFKVTSTKDFILNTDIYKSIDVLNPTTTDNSNSLWDVLASISKSESTAHMTKNNQFVSQDDEDWLPNVGAWRSVDNVAVLTPQLTLQQYLSGTQTISAEQNEKVVNELWRSLKNRGSIRGLNSTEIDAVIEALRIADIALSGKTTQRSMEGLVNRATGIACILGELNAPLQVILAAILHEVIADVQKSNDIESYEALKSTFGNEAITLAENYLLLPRFMARKTDYTPDQSENQLQMLVVSMEDYRTLYIRLADRIHTMRVLKSLPLDDLCKEKIAQEALNVYAPLAHKMGLMKVRGELEDLAFKMLDPEMYQRARYTQIAANKAHQEAADQIEDIIKNDPTFVEQQATGRLSYRVKDKYQLYMKMKRKNLASPSEVRDALGLRIVLDVRRLPDETPEAHELRTKSLCYMAVDRLRNMQGWEPPFKGFKDYILNKKLNGYESIHQYIRNKALGTNVEVQVRTLRMHHAAEVGEAAHWHYKDLIYKPEIAKSKIYRTAWRSKEQMKAKTPADLFAMAKIQLRKKRVFVYLEDMSNVLNLKKDASLLDAAFQIHTDVGLATKTVMINGKPALLKDRMKNSDRISVKCAVDDDGQLKVNAKPCWFEMLRDSNAQAKLRKYYRDNNRVSVICHGVVQLLMTMVLNHDKIAFKHGGEIPDSAKLTKLLHRTGLNMDEQLFRIGASNNTESLKAIGHWLKVNPVELVRPSSTSAVMWATMQGRNGWEDKTTKANLLIPLLRDILPKSGFPDIEVGWRDLFGAGTMDLDAEDRINYTKQLNDQLVLNAYTMEPLLRDYSSQRSLTSASASKQSMHVPKTFGRPQHSEDCPTPEDMVSRALNNERWEVSKITRKACYGQKDCDETNYWTITTNSGASTSGNSVVATKNAHRAKIKPFSLAAPSLSPTELKEARRQYIEAYTAKSKTI